ncbi:MAG: sensor histidine kinase [Vicinamibacterales bacterium]
METAATRATSLVRALADVKSIDEDALSLNLRHIDLCEIVEPIVRMLDRASERHPIVLAVETPPVIVSGDGERLGRVVENLITNAIKYSPGGGAIEVRLRRDNEFAVLTVADSGIGIPAHARERVFDIGFRTAEAARVAPGMGLGLHIAAEVVRRHGGRIEAEARDTGGAVFSVRLPIAADAAAVTGYGAA